MSQESRTGRKLAQHIGQLGQILNIRFIEAGTNERVTYRDAGSTAQGEDALAAAFKLDHRRQPTLQAERSGGVPGVDQFS